MFKNQLQELAQRSCFNLPTYACVREGPDHAPRFKASVNFNGEIFQTHTYSTTVRQAEHAAAEAALNSLSARGPSKSLTARVLDETGVYKNLLQETAHRAGLKLPVYTTIRSGPGHVPVFTSTVELAGMSFSGETAKTKKQAEKNAAIAAWSALKRNPNLGNFSEHHQENGGKWNVGRVIRRRDQYQHKGRMQRPNQNNNVNQPWKLTNPTFLSLLPPPPLTDSSFLSLLPPPPMPAASKIMPPSWPKDCHHQKSNLAPLIIPSHVKVQESPLPPSPPPAPAPPLPAVLEERDDYEWVNKISEAIKKEAIGGKQAIYSRFGAEKERIVDFSKPPPPLFKIPTSCQNQMFCGAQRIAPAVQIRSVIPVCAAPPLRQTSNQSPPSKEAPATAASSSSSTSVELASTLSKLKL